MEINIRNYLDRIEIWIDPQGSPQGGMCIGSGSSMSDAVAVANRNLPRVMLALGKATFAFNQEPLTIELEDSE